MKITTASTKFELNMEERKAIETVCSLLDSIHENMHSEDYFLDSDMYDIASELDFFERFKCALNYNEGIVEME